MKNRKSIFLIVLLIAAAAFSRLLMTGSNFTPIGAIALFGGAYIGHRYLRYIVPLIALWLSDLLLNNTLYSEYYDGFAWMGSPAVYIAFAVMVAIGALILQKQRSIGRVMGSAVLAALAFFLITNFVCWLEMPIYPKTPSGLMLSYEMGLPFFKNTLLSLVTFSAILFGGFEWYLRSQNRSLLTTSHA